MQENSTTEYLRIPLTIYTNSESGWAEVSNRTARLNSIISAIKYLADAQGLLEATNDEANMPYSEFTFVTRHLCEIAQAFTDDLEGSMPKFIDRQSLSEKPLSELISAVLNHPDIPTCLYDEIGEAINEVYNHGGRSSKTFVDSAENIALIIKDAKELDKEGPLRRYRRHDFNQAAANEGGAE